MLVPVNRLCKLGTLVDRNHPAASRAATPVTTKMPAPMVLPMVARNRSLSPRHLLRGTAVFVAACLRTELSLTQARLWKAAAVAFKLGTALYISLNDV